MVTRGDHARNLTIPTSVDVLSPPARAGAWARIFSNRKTMVAAAVLLLLLIVPAPLLPPHRVARAAQSVLGIGWAKAYFVAAIGLQTVFYGALGVLAAFAVNPAPTPRRRLLQIGILPLVVVGVALLIRSLKLGHLPLWINAAVPIAACLVGVGLGLGMLYRRAKVTLLVAAALIGVTLWQLLGGTSAELTLATKAHLQRLVAAANQIPADEHRFGALLQIALAPVPADSAHDDEVQNNRAAILAWGIAVGDERLARFVGLKDAELLRQAAALRQGTTLRGRADWSRHYALSAALAVLENPLISDAAGAMKEQLDALTGGSGFSFGDLAADRAGVRFAVNATRSQPAAKAMQARLQNGFALDDFFPPVADLPENLTVEQFRHAYGGVGSPRYRQQVDEIETRLDPCAALSPR
ncbi:MAG TPA: hypothetical protein VH370_05415 [Humisphaera sp.]|nr:hypothetical protein [Humisphaera sp.]